MITAQRKRIFSLLLTIIFVLSVAQMISAENPNDAPLGDSSVAYGLSGISPYGTTTGFLKKREYNYKSNASSPLKTITIYEKGKLTDNDTQLLVDLSGTSAMAKGVIIKPDGSTVTTLPTSGFMTVLGNSSTENKFYDNNDTALGTSGNKERLDTSLGLSGYEERLDTPSLGASGGNSSAAFAPYSDTIHYDLAFDIDNAGFYTIDFYANDADSLPEYRAVYYVSDVYPSSSFTQPLYVSLESMLFRPGTPQTLNITYVPQVINGKETVTIELPFGLTLNTYPTNEPGVKITKLERQLYSTQYYDDKYGSLFLEGIDSLPSNQRLTNTHIIINYDASKLVSGEQGITFQVTLRSPYSDTSAVAQFIAEIMRYSNDKDASSYDKMPYRIIAYTHDDVSGALLAEDSAAYTSIVTGNYGAIEKAANLVRNAPEGTKFSRTLPVSTSEQHLKIYSLPSTNLHALYTFESGYRYPILDLYYYTPLPDPTQVEIADSLNYSVESIGGKDYRKILVTDILHTATNPASYYDASSYQYIDTRDKLKPSLLSPIEFGDTYFSYTSMETGPTGYLPSYFVNPLNPPRDSRTYGLKFSSTGLISSERQKQGTSSNAIFGSGSFSMTDLAIKYLDPSLTLNFPFEVSPQSILLRATNKDVGDMYVNYYVVTKDNVDGPGVLHTIGPYDSASLPTAGINIPFNVTADEHVKKIVIDVDYCESFFPYSFSSFVVNSNYRTHDKDDNRLPFEKTVYIKGEIKYSQAIKYYGRPEAEWEYLNPLTPSSNVSSKVILWRAETRDSLVFGSRSAGPYTPAPFNNILDMRSFYNNGRNQNGFALSSKAGTNGIMKDYNDVKIRMFPQNESGQALWSLMEYLAISNIEVGTQVKQVEITYKTNLSPTPKTVTRHEIKSSILRLAYFDLMPNEYITEIEVDFGDIYGESWGAGHTWLSGDTSNLDNYGRLANDKASVYFNYLPSETLYPGIEGKEEKVNLANTTTAYIDAEITVGDTAQYVNSSDHISGYLANKGRAQLNFQIYQDLEFISKNSYITKDQQIYQGNSIPVYFYETLNYGDIKNSVITKLPRRVYIEVAPFVDILSFPNHITEQIKELDNGNRLYVFYSDLPTTMHVAVEAKFYIRPDAPTDQSPIPYIYKAIVSYDELNDNYLSNDDYYLESPYNKYTFKSATSPIPTNWGEDINVYFDLGSANFNKILLFTSAGLDADNLKNGSISKGVDGHIFREHEKDNLGIQVNIYNASQSSSIDKHETHITLPRTTRNTASIDENDQPSSVVNDYNLYLTGDMFAGTVGKAFDVRYEDINKNPVVPTTASDYANITDIYIITHNIGKENVSFRFPLATDYSKPDTDNYSAFVGLSGRSIILGVEPFVNTKALTYLFDSYQLNIRLGYDRLDIGCSDRELPMYGSDYPVKAEVFDASDQLIGTVSSYEGVVPVNDDASYIKLTYDKNMLMLTKKNHPGLGATGTTDSDFERDNDDKLFINFTALKNDITHQHDAGFIIIPHIMPNPSSIDTAVSYMSYTTIDLMSPFTYYALPSQYYYTYELLSTSDPNIATVNVNNATRRFEATGVKKGDTYLTFKITNRLGDEFLYKNTDGTPKELPIRVTPFYFNTGRITATLETGSVLVEYYDRFNVKYWGEGESATPKTVSGISTYPIAIAGLERSAINYIKPEIPASYKGYEFVKFNIVAGGNNIPVTSEADGSFSYELPVAFSTATVEMVFRNTTLNVNLKKTTDPNSVMIDANDKFSIKVTEVGSATPIVDQDFGWNESAALSLTYGKTYEIEETLSTTPAYMKNYFLNSVKVVDSSNISVPDETVTLVSQNKYTVRVRNSYSDGNTIVAQNTYKTGPGITSSKITPLFNLPSESFEFILEGNNNFKAYGKATSDGTSANNAIAWFSDAGHTTSRSVAVLPYGDYEISEVLLGTNSSFEFDKIRVDSSDVSGTTYSFTVGESTTAIKNIELHNKVKVIGEVTVNKTAATSIIASDAFVFTLKNTATGDTFTSTANVTSSTSSSIVFNQWKNGGQTYSLLPLGEYTLTEDLSTSGNYIWDGFDASNIGSNSGASLSLSSDSKTATFKLSAALSGSKSVTVSGENKLKTGTLKINKYVQGSKAELPQDFKFDLYRISPDGSAVQIDQSGSPSVNPIVMKYLSSTIDPLSVTLTDMPYGRYFIKEHLNDYFLLMGSSDATEVGSSDPNKVLTLQSEVTPSEFNVYNKSKTAQGNFTVYKKLTSLVPLEPTEFKVELHDKSGLIYTGKVTIDEGNFITGGVKIVWEKIAGHQNGSLDMLNSEIKDLGYGTYTLKETATGTGYSFKEIISRGSVGQAVSGQQAWTFEINRSTDSADLTFDVVNKTAEIASLQVNKIVDGGNTFPHAVFKFTIENRFNSEKYEAEVKTGQSITSWKRLSDNVVIANGSLPLGEYILSESNTPNFVLDSFKDIVPNTAGTATSTNASLVLNSSHSSVTITAVNKVKSAGVLTITKDFENNYNHNSSSSFNFLLYGPEIGGVMPTTPVTITSDKNGNWQASKNSLVFGKYIVKEDLSSMSDYELVSMSDGVNPAITTNGATFIVGEDTGQLPYAKIDVVNRVASTGKLSIKKIIEGENGNPNATFTFEITDANKNQQTITLKAGEEKVLSNLLYGDVSVIETLEENYNHTGGEINVGARTNTLSFTVPVMDPSGSSSLVSYSKNKNDGSLTIEASVTEELKEQIPGEGFEFILYRSIDNGQTWTPVTPKTRSSSIILAIGDSYTYSNLLRGALYRADANTKATQMYQVSDIIPSSNTIGITDIKAGTFTFQPEKDNLLGSVSFLLDIKRIDLTVYKHFIGAPTTPGVGVRFTILRIVNGKNHFYRKGENTNDIGVVVFDGLPAGEYVLSESYAPRGFVVIQPNTYFTITNNLATGNLDITVKSNKHAYFENDILSVMNDWRLGGGSDGSDKLDENSLLNKNEKAVLTENIPEETPDVGPNKLPSAGGLPVSYISFVGLAAMMGGGALLWKEKKDANKQGKSKNQEEEND